MRILGVDTSTKYAGVAVIENETMLAKSTLKFMASHSEKLLPEIAHLLEIMEIPLDSIDYYAVTVGPGSFTGLRVGISTVKGLAFVTGKNVIPVSSLEVIARGFPYLDYSICPLLDARKKEVYSAVFKWKNQSLIRIREDAVSGLEQLQEWIDDNTLFVGEGANIYKDKLIELFAEKAIFAEPFYGIPSPEIVALIGLERAKKGIFVSAKELKPCYLRKSEAEIKFG